MQYEVLRVNQCQNKEKYKLLAESLVQGTGRPSTSKCGRARHGLEQVGGATASTRTCVRSLWEVNSAKI